MQSEGDGINAFSTLPPKPLPWWERLKRNDPEVTNISISWREFESIEGLGKAIGNSTCLKDVFLQFEGCNHDWVHDFCRWLPHNRSIETLHLMEDCAFLFDDAHADLCSSLARFFKNNKKFRNIKFCCRGRSRWTIESIEKALSSCRDDQLEQIELHGIRLADKSAARFIDSLNTHVGLLTLSISDIFDNTDYDDVGGDYYGNRAYDALATLLQNPASNIQKLQVKPDLEVMEILSHALIENNSLTSLDVSCGIITDDFFAVLSHPLCSLEELIMSCPSEFYDEDITCLGNALAVNKTLKHLQLCGNYEITPIGWGAFSNCLRSSNSPLEFLNLRSCSIDDESASIIFSALTSNSALKILHMRCDHRYTTARVWGVLSRTICDTPSIDSIAFSSNHTIHTIDICSEEEGVPEDLISLLEMNKNDTNAGSARLKILKYKFSEEKSSMHIFARMPEAVLPCAIGWVGKDRHGYSAMYNLLRCLPSVVCGSCSDEHNAAPVTKKRKLCTNTPDTNTNDCKK
jgi:hypothetical protein